MANGDVINFNRYPSAMLDESEMKTLDIAMSCDPDRSSHYSHHNHHHHHHHHHHLQQQQQQQSNHVIPNNLMTTTTTITPSSTAATSESCDSKSRRSQCLATSGVIVTGNGCEGGPGNGSSVGRNAWRSVVGGCRRLKERCQQDDDHTNSFLSICSRVFLVVVNFFFLVCLAP
ncbi:hypothetical protein HELRODRAFT_166468 [Helobdella robusta]|uniref:Uncharacterized protein n=1 Tax=Helobdella robusta TaxID=6412 RepID=T1EY59_HELRO|nr:hypothetical protein HELRODRAFT_166468 [Helobdella robusta]ESO11478.1 hypothetical protein HELRODRAFT_166468 [Helobdella robusta]